MRIFKNKKAATLDNFYVIIQFFAVAIFLLVMFKVWTSLTTAQMDTDLWDKSSIGQTIKSNTQRAFNQWDWIFVMVYFGLHLGVVVLAFMLRSHPIVLVGGIMLALVLVMVAVPLSNTWEEISRDSEFTTEIALMPKVDMILLKLPIFETIWAFITLIALASFSKAEGYW